MYYSRFCSYWESWRVHWTQVYMVGEQWNTKDRRTGPLDRAKMPVRKTIPVYGNGRHCKISQFFRFLHQNLITKIENLDSLQNLGTLNLSNNMITRLENLRMSLIIISISLFLGQFLVSSVPILFMLSSCGQLLVSSVSKTWYEQFLIPVVFTMPPRLSPVAEHTADCSQ